MKHTILLLSILTFQVSHAQVTEINHCNKSSELYKDNSAYIPVDDFPILTLKVNYIFLQRDNGCCGFSKNNPEHMDFVKRTLKKINDKFAYIKDPKSSLCYKGEDFIPDSKIRFKLNEIIEIQDDDVWNIDNGSMCPNDKDWFINKVDTLIFNDPRYTNSINIYFPNSLVGYTNEVELRDSLFDYRYINACSQLPSRRKLVRSSKVSMPNKTIKMFRMKNFVVNDTIVNPKKHTWESGIYYWFWSSIGSGMAHELGHSMGLMHSNEHHGINKCFNAIMNQKSKSPRNFFPPTEIGKMHKNMRMSNIRDFLSEEVYSPVPWVISEDFNVDLDYKVYEDIIVKAGTTLTVSCNMVMSPETKIILEPGARLDLTLGTVNPVKNQTWQGVELIVNKRCFRFLKHDASKDAIINLSNMFGHEKVSRKKIKR